MNQQLEDYPEELRGTATSLAIEKGGNLSRAELVRVVLQKLENLYKLYMEKGFYPIRLLWESYAVSIGKQITARTISGSISGKALGITEEGVLRIEDEAGEIHHVYSADIELDS